VKRLALFFALVSAAVAGCVGTTGGELTSFDAYAAGPADARPGEPYTFETSRGYTVVLSRATLHVGAVYLNRSRPSSVSADTSCQLAGIYVAEVTSGLDVDVLSPALQPFPEPGFATTEHARTAEVWLFGNGDINEVNDDTAILDIAGTATKDGQTIPFEGRVTISDNRVVPPPSPAAPGAHPICKQRIVTPIPVDLDVEAGKDLILRVDPRGFFRNVDFGALAQIADDPPLYRFEDDSSDQPSTTLYSGLRASVGTYTLTWEATQ